ncbi:MAG: hypothetical protein AB1746_15345, partial [Candidatus Zixiibacteriota bacterium]
MGIIDAIIDKKITLWGLFLIILTLGGGAGAEPETNDPISQVLIDSISIENNNIFNPDSAKYDLWIFHLANRLHIRTKKYVIARELLLDKGEPFSRRLADESERNLRALPFLWNAQLNMVKGPSGENVLKVTTSDTWTLLGGMSINRSAGETVVHMRAEEQNLLGTGQYVSLHHYVRDTLEDYSQFSFLERRLFNSRMFLQVFYDGNPEIGQTSVSLGRPFFSLDSKYSAQLDYISWDRRDDYYESGYIIAQNKIEGNQLVFSGASRTGS